MRKKITKKITSSRTRAKKDNSKESKNTSFPVVGIGASAGGMEAFISLLRGLPQDLGPAYIFIQHLSPDHTSMLPEILGRNTAIPVHQIEDGLRLEPNKLYVNTPHSFVSIDGGAFKLKSPDIFDPAIHQIDYFLMSLASEYQNRTIGIILSGVATDGALGLKAIKAEGGITFAQDESAKYHGMPRHAIDLGHVDFVLPPKGIAEELKSLIANPFVVNFPQQSLMENEKELKRILGTVSDKRGVDFFSNYKKTTVHRRIIRRMALNRINSLEEYSKILIENNSEVDALYQDFLINVTSFFREPTFYNALSKKIFPKLVKGRKLNDVIRIWIPGCASGEEAYSTAICLLEFLEKKELNIPVQIFSTDLNEKAIEKARAGIYSKSALQNISPQRLKRFFVKLNGGYQLAKLVREVCIFAPHDLIKDPPFSRIDLISCQNVLIYLEPIPQKKIMQTFHYALKPTGFLLLGKSETIGTSTDLFQQFDKEFKIYSRKAVNVQPDMSFSMRPHPVGHGAIPTDLISPSLHRIELDIDKEIDKILLSKYVPASVLVNKDLEILRFRGSTTQYLDPVSGKASLHLLKMIRDDLTFELRALIQKVKKENRPVKREGLPLDFNGSMREISIEIIPIRLKYFYYLILFKEGTPVSLSAQNKTTIKKERQDSKDKKILRLEHELREGREQMRSMSEEFEATREELQSANEEVLSSNEELQSINEELETSKEELQSSNEELITINEELQNRNAELKEERDYSETIIQTMRGPLLVLRSDLRILTVNQSFLDAFRLTHDETEGSFLYEIGNKEWDLPVFRERLKEVLSPNSNFKDFEITHKFARAGKRTLLINAHRLMQRNSDEALILLIMEDISQRREVSQRLMQAQDQLKLALIKGSVCTWIWNIKTNEIQWSKDVEYLYGLPYGGLTGGYEVWEKTIHPDDLMATRNAMQSAINSRKELNVEFRIVWKDGSIHWILARAQIQYDQDGLPENMSGTHIDITDRKQAEIALEESENRFRTVCDQAPVMIWMAGPGEDFTFFNKTLLLFSGKDMDELVKTGWFSNVHPDDREKCRDSFKSSFKKREEFKAECRMKQANGEYHWILNYGVPQYAADGNFTGYIGTSVDITDRIELERQKDDFMSIASHELKTPVTSIKAYAEILNGRLEQSGDQKTTELLTKMDAQIIRLSQLITTLLDVARIEGGKVDLNMKRFPLNDFVEEVLEEVRIASGSHRFVKRLKASGDVYADKDKLRQVISNLISNAVKYSPDTGKIVISSYNDGEYLCVSVQDFGIGIEKEIQRKVFERFFRVSESSGNRVSGLGLGLYISAEIIKQHKGKIWLESTPGDGSSFYFSLPKVGKRNN